MPLQAVPRPTAVRLVIVDDHEVLANVLAMALRHDGLDVETASGPTAEAVVATVRRRAPALVLLDLDLGPLLGSGLDLIGPMIAAGGRVVMITAVEECARLGACLAVGAERIVSKKAGFASLLSAVRQAVEGERLTV